MHKADRAFAQWVRDHGFDDIGNRNAQAGLKSIKIPSKAELALQIAGAGASAYGGYENNMRLNDKAAKSVVLSGPTMKS